MILIITHKEDYTVDFLINKLNEENVSYLRLNCEDLFNEPSFSILESENFLPNFEGFGEITSVWFRRTQIPALDDLDVTQRLYFIKEFDALLENIYCTLLNRRWLSNPFSIKKAENKLLQLSLAKGLGFKVPKTLVTNSKDKIKSFFFSNNKTIIKPIYSGYVPNGKDVSLFYTSILSEKHISEIDRFDLTPCIFQEYIEKDYELRITVVNDIVFASKVESQKNENSKIDWRRERLTFTKQEIPGDLRDKCVNLCKSLDLKFGAIDIIKNKNGDYTFLEINPNGQWAWIEMETDLKISKAIINYLTFKAC
jgi:glutathione synthase/RimK-type ligase-like ATP-grasp enzyme